jgi:hypothetical protein
MNRWKLAAILSDYADGLFEGVDTADVLLSEYPQESAELGPLFRLAASLQSVLVPVRAPVSFVSRLHEDLMSYSPTKVVIEQERSGQKALWVGVAAAGSVLSVAGLVVLVLRRLRGTEGAVGTAV